MKEEDAILCIDIANDKMQKAIEHLENELKVLRAGRANPNMLSGVMVDYYGTMTPLAQVASIGSPDARSINIQPWEKKMIEPIEKAIMAANLGFTPVNNGEIVRISIPPLTEERRKEMVKKVKTEGENAKIAVRNVRRNVVDSARKLTKDGVPEDEVKNLEKEIQTITDKSIEKVDQIISAKEKDIMTV